jgi:hypothetical protein
MTRNRMGSKIICARPVDDSLLATMLYATKVVILPFELNQGDSLIWRLYGREGRRAIQIVAGQKRR